MNASIKFIVHECDNLKRPKKKQWRFICYCFLGVWNNQRFWYRRVNEDGTEMKNQLNKFIEKTQLCSESILILVFWIGAYFISRWVHFATASFVLTSTPLASRLVDTAIGIFALCARIVCMPAIVSVCHLFIGSNDGNALNWMQVFSLRFKIKLIHS